MKVLGQWKWLSWQPVLGCLAMSLFRQRMATPLVSSCIYKLWDFVYHGNPAYTMKLGQLGVIITTSLDNEVGQELASIASTTTSKDLHYHIEYHRVHALWTLEYSRRGGSTLEMYWISIHTIAKGWNFFSNLCKNFFTSMGMASDTWWALGT